MENHDRPTRRVRRVRSSSTGPCVAGDGTAAAALSVRELPVLPVRNAVLLPNMVVPLFVDDEPALRAVEDALAHDKTILIVAQRTEETGDPLPGDVFQIGTECAINRVLKVPDDVTSLVVQGLRRFRIDAWLQQAPYGRVRGVAFDEPHAVDERIEAYARVVLGGFETVARTSSKLNEDTYIQALNIERPGALADFVASQIELPVAERQKVLEAVAVGDRLQIVYAHVRREVRMLELEHQIQTEVQRDLERGQREEYLRRQMQVIQRELGGHDPTLRELMELHKRLEEARLPDGARERAQRELERLESLPPMAPEHSVLRGYLDWLLGLPWRQRTEDRLDLTRVAEVLDANHYGLAKIKDRILDFMAVRQLAPEGRAPILCLAGPPGVGKTSLGRSIAEALGRKFVRVSLGGVHDEAEIRGHRRTYVGAMPGRVLQTMKLAGTINPVFVLDEVDKLCSDYRGDPAAALLEVLDPEQNSVFSDHYLEVPYDLSKVLFVLTANVLHTIPAPLRDRMEVIEIPGYTEDEKAHIALDHLVPRLLRDSGLSSARFEIDEGAVRRVIREYTFEAGVRNLERELGAIMRRVARRVAEGKRHKATVTAKNVPVYLGPQKHFPTEAEESDQIGVATGLAWTAAGGDLTTVEVMAVPGRGNLQLTGQLGDVMKESAQAALTFTRARAAALGLPEAFHERNDLHVHLPAAGIPKDGPSAGLTMAVAMISALTGRPIRREVAMTGEITLRGRILPVGGIKEKVLAAHRAGITAIILPQRNLKDLDDVPAEVRDALEFRPVETMDEVIALALRCASSPGTAEPARSPSGSASTRPPITPRSRPDELPEVDRVARPRARRTAVVVGQPTGVV